MNGVVLVSFGKPGYAYAAYNLALTIKHHNPKVRIALIHDKNTLKYLDHTIYRFVDKFIPLPLDMEIKKDPAQIKTGLYDLLPWKGNLYLDIDAVCLKDIQPMINELSEKDGFYLTEVRGYSGKGEKRNYSIWAKDDDIWDFFQLEEGDKFPAIQSSWAWIEKTAKSKKFFAQLERFYKKGFPIRKIQMNWGGTIPDELLFGGACAKMGLNPDGGRYIFFGWRSQAKFADITANNYLSSIYGNGVGQTLVGKRYFDWYERLVEVATKKQGLKYKFKLSQIKRDKHANNF